MRESLFESPNAVAHARTAKPDLQLIVDTVPGLVSYVDRNFCFVFTNRRHSEWFGCSQSDLVGKHLSDVLGADVFLHLRPFLEKGFAGEPATFEGYRKYGSGPPRFVKTTIVPDVSDGYVKGVVVLVEDITDRKRAEDAERDLEGQLTLLIEASASLLASPITADVLKNILDVARRFIEADAYSVWRRKGEEWHMAASEGLSPGYSSAAAGVSKVLAARLPIVTEDVDTDAFVTSRREVYKAEGIQSLITVPLQIHNEIAATLVFYYRNRHHFTTLETRVASALGNLAAAAIGSADLYQRQSELREKAEANEHRAAFLAEAGQILSSSLDFDQTLAALVELAVPRFADVAAVEVLDPSGENRRIAIKHCDPSKLDFVKDFRRNFPPLADDDIARVALQTGQSKLIEDIPDDLLVQRARSPEHLEALRHLGIKSLILAPLIANNRKFGLLTFVTADSGRHYGQADLNFAEELARRAATAMDHARLFAESNEAQNALRRSNAELSRANDDLNQFAYSASHDLQEPLRMLVIYSQLLNRKYRDVLEGQASEYLGFIVEGAKRMEMLLTDLLAYMQVVNFAPLPTVAANTNAALNRVLETMAMSISDSGATIECEDLPPLAIEQFHLVQLFQNLISNAIKYRSEQPPHVRVSCNLEGSGWKICVKDNGIGIPPEYRDQVFKVFKRLHEKDKYPGTGIGLSICQKIVERYGGSIWIESSEGTGSTICIQLPEMVPSTLGRN
ncbi:MAG: GAF domain-containing protein [Acidobacteriaceae bacterium]|nr:GAF domain-containing protein [Acidobacteriaceae bacterium]